MRWIPIALVLALLVAACTITPGNGSSSDGGASTPCDNKGDCMACVNCAGQVQCATQANKCDQNSVCLSIVQCITGGICNGDKACEQQCLDNNPAGVSDYNALADCLYCEQCPHDCAGFRQCG